ncbi:SLC13 family permease [Marinigracilibium pacificum]|uniref:SLC13 family permease n=1 Tax=Marinigracilibium pacificum TaxID=2729599 RepID=A0A848J0X5_9BACT|nr:SLC13 family permease [Marinigracilibium pacificum]NMM48134.1 SLC13 family permease [Marinigracilibium pacificum]
MSIDAIITLVVIVIALILFVKEVFQIDLVALGLIVVLVLSGVITVEQGLAGFSNEATLTVAAMFVLSSALIKTQVINYIGPLLTKTLDRSYKAGMLGLGAFVAGLSAFVNNTPIVATLIPLVSTTARNLKVSPSRFLMPLSYFAIFGGTCTLIGTSTNLLVKGMATERGIDEISMFTFTPFGIILFIAGTTYLVLFGKKIIPERSSPDELKDQEGVKRFLAEVRTKSKPEEESKMISNVFENEEIKVKILKRGDQVFENPDPHMKLQKDDELLIEGNLKRIRSLVERDYFSITDSFDEKQFPDEETRLVEIVLLSNSSIIGKRLSDVDFLFHYDSEVIAIRQRGKKQLSNLKEIKLKAGDILVLLTNKKGYELIQQSQTHVNQPFISLRVEQVNSINKKDILIVTLVILIVILLASFGLVSVVIAAFGGIIALNLMGIINMADVYRSIDWKVIFLLAGSLSLGEAMSSSGLSNIIGEKFELIVSSYGGPVMLVGLFYLTTVLLTEMVSNNASAALMVPIAFSVAESMEVNVLPLLLTIAFAGSASFMTPVGYQTNTMIYSAGNYYFRDFTKAGAPLSILFWILAMIFIPLIYPFH